MGRDPVALAAAGILMKILSLSLVYPNPDEPGLGLFVRSRLQALAELAAVKVVAPIPWLDYSNPKGKLLRGRAFPGSRWDGPVEVFHPRWLFPPNGTPLNVACLAARLLPMLRRIRRDFPFDLIDAHFGYPEGSAATLLSATFGLPFAITLRGNEPVFAGYRYRRAALRWAFRRASRVIAVSEDLRQFAVKLGAPEERTITIPNGVDGDVFYSRERIAATRKTIVSAGELIEAKGHHLVAEALKGLLDEGVDAELLIVGGTARGGARFEETLRRRVVDLGLSDRVRFVGVVDRNGMAELLSAADVFCLASFTEGWPNVLNEALACGAPAVATRVGGVPAMLPDERYGIMVPPQNLAALRDALREALSRQWDREAISARGRARSWQQVAREVHEVMQGVVSGAHPNEALSYVRN
jgi:teichuronic acid biosynthesis glycosyltransferase TuaC